MGFFEPVKRLDRLTRSATLQPSSCKSTLCVTPPVPPWTRDQFPGLCLDSETAFTLGHVGVKKPLMLMPALH